jgi:hypothetical protein
MSVSYDYALGEVDICSLKVIFNSHRSIVAWQFAGQFIMLQQMW